MDVRDDGLAGQQANGLALGIALVIGACCAAGTWAYSDYRAKSAIQRHGQRQEAAVLGVHQKITKHYKSGDSCDYVADYQLVPQGRSSPVTQSIRWSCYTISPVADYISRNHTVPIAYDETDPAIARLNFNDEVFREDTGRMLKLRLLILSCAGALGIATVTALSFTRRA